MIAEGQSRRQSSRRGVRGPRMILHGRLLTDPTAPPREGWVAVEGDRIVEIGHGRPRAAADAGDADAIICPAFVDAHLHLPQIDSIGCDGMDLLAWLDRVIFPAEMRWESGDVAREQTTRAFQRMLRAGTMTCAGYLSSHPHAFDAVREVHGRLPLRAMLGTAWVDRNVPAAMCQAPTLPPDDDGRLRFSVNPRFAVACSDDLLERAGHAAADGRTIQTHLAEQPRECALVRELFPQQPSYTAVYDAFGLLRPGTLLAHCLHLDEAEWALIAERDAVVVHCPTANLFLGSGVFDLAAARANGVTIALGSDVAAGPDLAMPRVARAMIDMAKARRLTVDPSAVVPTPAEAWHMITAGNAAAIGCSDAGRLEAGSVADLLVLRTDVPDDEFLIGRLIHGWRDAFIAERVLAGRREPC